MRADPHGPPHTLAGDGVEEDTAPLPFVAAAAACIHAYTAIRFILYPRC